MDMEDNFFGIIIVIIGIAFVWTLNYGGMQINEIKQELGGSICDQEYNMDYESYSDGELSCKPKEVKETIPYDGIKINIKEAR